MIWMRAPLWLVPWLLTGAILAADPSAPLPAESLRLRAADGSTIPFADLLGPDGRAVCFAFLHPACPLAQEYGPVLGKLAVESAKKGIRFVGVVCECDDAGEIEDYRKTYGITFPISTDTDFHLAEALDATITPEVVIVDRDRRIRYSGRIDDRYKIRGVMTPGDARPELANAIQDLLAGREIREPRTKAAGCPLDRPERPVGPPNASATNKNTPTFFRDVLPFLHAQCQKCHSPGQAGPFSLLSYDDAVEWVELGLEEITARRMPPAQIESDLDFMVTKPPTAVEVAMLRAWVAAGKPEGDATDTPNLAPLPDYSLFQEDLGPPDIVLEQPELTQLGSHGNDVYRNIMFPLNRDEDLRVRAIQFLPRNRKVVHHALVGHLPRETAEKAVREHGGRDGFSHPDDRAGGFQDSHGIGFRVPPVRDDGQPRASFVSGYVPGVRATVAPDDAAVVIPAGCDLSAQVHHVRTGKLETESSRIGLWLEKQPLLLLRVPQWDYNWQSPYNLKQPRRFPAGTRFDAECSFDNSSANPRNPFDPPRNVWHNETIKDDMLLPMFMFASEKPLDAKGESFKKFYFTISRSRLLRRLVDHRFKYVADPKGNVALSPDYDPDDQRY